MISKIPRIAALALISLVVLLFLYKSDPRLHIPNHHGSAHSPPGSNAIPHSDPVAPPPAAAGPGVIAADPNADSDKWNYGEHDDAPPSDSRHKEYKPVPTQYPVFDRKSPYAYLFWATSDEYACSAIVNINKLVDFRTRHHIYVMVTEDVSKEYVETMTELNATVKVVGVPDHPAVKKSTSKKKGVKNHGVENTLMKLLAFRMHQIVDGVKRVIVLDSDIFIYKPLDTLFELPDIDVAATRDLYAKNKATLNSALMMITLSDRLWTLVDDAMKKLTDGQYANYLVNKLFMDSAMILPGQFLTSDTHWFDWTVPAWFRPEPDVHDQSMISKHSQGSMSDLWKVININVENEAAKADDRSKDGTRSIKLPMAKRNEGSEEVQSLSAAELLQQINSKAEAQQKKSEEEKAKKQSEDKMKEAKNKEESERKAKEEANKKAKEEAEKKIKEEAEKKAKEQAASGSKVVKDTKPEDGKQMMDQKLADEKAKAEEARKKAEAGKPRPDTPLSGEKKVEEKKEGEKKAEDQKADDKKPEEQKDGDKKQEEEKKEEKAVELKKESTFVPEKKEDPKTKPRAPLPYTRDTHPARNDLNGASGRVAVLHYVSRAKPWELNIEGFKHEPDTEKYIHPQMIEQFKHWRETARSKCPRVKVTRKNGNGDVVGEEWFHFVNNV